jgi:hypothetical protein
MALSCDSDQVSNLGTRSALAVATLVAALLPASASMAGTAGPGVPEPRTVTVVATCTGPGRVVVQQTAGVDETHVVIDGYGLPDRRWTGYYELEVGVDDTNDVQLRLRSVDGRFHRELDVPGTGEAGILDLRRGKPQACHAAFDEDTPLTIASGTRMNGLVRNARAAGRLQAVSFVDCRVGTRWRIEGTVTFVDQVADFRQRPRTCRRGWLYFRSDVDLTVPATGAPVALTVVAHGSEGQRRRAAYRATSPAV